MAVDLSLRPQGHLDWPNNTLQYRISLTRAVPINSKAEKTTDTITHTIVTAINGDILVLQIKIQYWVHSSPLLSWQTWIHASPTHFFNPLMPNDDYSGCTAPLTSKHCILYIYSINIGTEYFKRGIYSPFFPLQNAVCFINLTYLVPVLYTFYKEGVLKWKK